MSSGRPQVGRVRTEGERVASPWSPEPPKESGSDTLGRMWPPQGDPTPPQGCAAAHLELSWASAEGS